MIKLILIDMDKQRSRWLSDGLAAAGFFVVASVDKKSEVLNEISMHRPQIVLISPFPSIMDGANLVSSIMEKQPVPVVMLTDPADPDAEENVSWCGAMSVMPVPPAPEYADHEQQMSKLATMLKIMYVVPAVRRSFTPPPRDKEGTRLQTAGKLSTAILSANQTEAGSSLQPSMPISMYSRPRIIGIASSTGGPKIVQEVLQDLPADYPIPIVLVQHLSEGFSDTLANMLQRSFALGIKEISSGDAPQPGMLHIASRQYHVRITKDFTFELLSRYEYDGHCPSGTLMLKSLAQVYGASAMGIVLTGMGADGADGLLCIRKKGGLTLAQDSASCIIDSMPTQAVIRGAVNSVLTPKQMNKLLLKWS